MIVPNGYSVDEHVDDRVVISQIVPILEIHVHLVINELVREFSP